jgi:hypothetical protein
MTYKEFRISGKLFAISGFGISLVTDTGNYGFRIWKDAISIKYGGGERFYYWC